MSFNISKRIYGGPMSPKIFSKLMRRQFAASPRDGMVLSSLQGDINKITANVSTSP